MMQTHLQLLFGFLVTHVWNECPRMIRDRVFLQYIPAVGRPRTYRPAWIVRRML